MSVKMAGVLVWPVSVKLAGVGWYGQCLSSWAVFVSMVGVYQDRTVTPRLT